MDERHIPDLVIRPEWKKKKPRGDKGLVKECESINEDEIICLILRYFIDN